MTDSGGAGGEEADFPKSIDFYPFAYAMYNDCLHAYCWNCLTEKQNLKICAGCKTAWFCNEDCIALAWKDHKLECDGFKRTKSVPDIEVRLLGRIVLRHKSILKGEDKKDPNFYLNRTSERQILDIWAHVEEIRRDVQAMQKFEGIYKKLCDFYGPRQILDKDEVFELHCRDFINRHAISDRHYMREIGKGLYLDLCAYDHSCAPNAIYVCNGLVATLRPLNSSVNLRDRKNTFYSYIELVLTKQQRQKQLKDTWYFNCECSRCLDNSEHILSSMVCPNCPEGEKETICVFGEQPYKDPQTQVLTCPRCKQEITQKQVMDSLTGMRFISDLLDKQELDQMTPSLAFKYVLELRERFKSFLSKYNVYYCKLIEAIIRLIKPTEHEEIVELYLAAEPCVRLCFPQNHPALAFHLRNIGLEFYRLEKFDEAIRYLDEAHNMLKYVMPDGHPLEKSSRAVLETVKLKAQEARSKPSQAVPQSEAEPEALPVSEETAVAAKSQETNKVTNETADKQESVPEAPAKSNDGSVSPENGDTEAATATTAPLDASHSETETKLSGPAADLCGKAPNDKSVQQPEAVLIEKKEEILANPEPEEAVVPRSTETEIRRAIAKCFLEDDDDLPELK